VKVQLEKQFRIFWKWAKAFFWRRQTIYALIVIIVLSLVVVQLSVIPKNFAQVENDYAQNVSVYTNIGANPLSLPHKLASFGLLQLFESTRIVRAVSIVMFGIFVVALYRILKRWHSDKIALLATFMFATNATVLATGRLGTPLVLLFGWSLVISLLLWLQHGHSRKVAPFMLLVISAALLYVPGAPYFFLLLFILFGNKIVSTIKHLKRKTIYLAILVSILVLVPLVISFYNDVSILKQWLLLPQTIDWSSIPKNILRVPSAFIFRSPDNPLLNIGRLPVLDVAAGGFLLIGLYAYQKNSKLERTRIMILTAFFGVIFGALGELTVAITLLLPFVFAVIAAGISFVLDEWYSVFPRNPFARSFGLLVVTAVVLMSSYYQITRFLVVWPQTPQTRTIYSQPNLIQ
jgi:hypothetical protein